MAYKLKTDKELQQVAKTFKGKDKADIAYAAELLKIGETKSAKRFIDNLDSAVQQECYTEYELPDDLNPEYLFSCTATDLLTQIVNGEIIPKELAWQQLRNRGLNAQGIWVGFGEGKCAKPF